MAFLESWWYPDAWWQKAFVGNSGISKEEERLGLTGKDWQGVSLTQSQTPHSISKFGTRKRKLLLKNFHNLGNKTDPAYILKYSFFQSSKIRWTFQENLSVILQIALKCDVTLLFLPNFRDEHLWVITEEKNQSDM